MFEHPLPLLAREDLADQGNGPPAGGVVIGGPWASETAIELMPKKAPSIAASDGPQARGR